MKKTIIAMSLMFAALGYSAWSWVFQSGLYALLVRWQAKTFDTYFPSLTFAAVFFGLLLLIYPIELAMGVSRTPKKSNREVGLDELNTRLKQKSRRFLIAMLILIVSAFAAFYLGQSAPDNDQPVTQIDLGNYSDHEDKNYWFQKVELNGVLLNRSSYSIISKNNSRGYSSETRYTPIATKGKSQEPIRFVHLKTSNHNSRTSSKLAMTGFVMPSVLPVLVRDTFEADGLILADRVHVIGKSIVSLKLALYITAGILGLIAFFLLVSVLAMPLANRRLIKEWHDANGQT